MKPPIWFRTGFGAGMLLAALGSVCLDLVESLLMLPILSFGGLVLWFSLISLLFSPSLSWGGVFLRVSSKTTYRGGV